MKKIVLSTILAVVLFSACNKTWNDPNDTMPATKISLITLLAAPTVYDGAGVNVRGMVWDIVHDDLVYSNDGFIETLSFVVFKVSNREGNFVNVYTEKMDAVNEGDMVEVVGIYRRNFVSEFRSFTNEIEAKKITVIKSVKDKYQEG
jgi:hypothetical protein